MFTPEADVLKPVDPSITDSNEWEIFVLSNARVVYESNGKPANLLSAYADMSLKVQGQLDAPSRTNSKYCTSGHDNVVKRVMVGLLTRIQFFRSHTDLWISKYET